MKKKYDKPEIITEDVGIAFAAACCQESQKGQLVGTVNPRFCKPTCHLDRTNYAVT